MTQRSPQTRPRRLRATAAAALAGVVPALLSVSAASGSAATPADGTCVTSGLSTTCTFGYTGAAQEWVVPAGVRSATFEVLGAAGGATEYPWTGGGRGGGVKATVRVVPGATMQVYVGGQGQRGPGGLGGWNGGGNGGGAANPHGAGGGGASDVRATPYGPAMRILVGGGGGGQGSILADHGSNEIPGWGGNGGGSSGGGVGPGRTGGSGGMYPQGGPPAVGGGGGTLNPGAGGSAGFGVIPDACNGADALGVAGNGAIGAAGGAGGFMRTRGTDQRCDSETDWGGGGGGGYAGGGGGGAGPWGGAGGGGGSGFGPGTSTGFTGELNADGRVTVTYLSPSTPAWVSLGGTLTSAPTISERPATGLVDAVQDVFYLNAKSEVIHRTMTAGVLDPTEDNLGGPVSPGSTVAAVSYAFNRIDVFARGTDNVLWHKWWDGQRWSAWVNIYGNVKLTSSPTVASWGPGRLDVFARGIGNDLIHTWSTEGYNFNKWESLGGTLSTDPAAVSWGPGRIDIFTGTPGVGGSALQQKVYDAGWAGWFPFSDKAMTSAPSVSSADVGELDIHYRNWSNGLSRRSYTPQSGWLPTIDAGAAPSPAGSAPAVASLTSGQQIVLVRGTDNTLQARTYP